MSALIIGFLTFLTSLLLVWIVGAIAYRKGWLAHPREDRWHRAPVALYGGVGIFAAFFFGLAAFFTLESVQVGAHLFREPLTLLLIGSLIMFAVGLIDDRLHIKPSTKLVGEIIAVAIPIALGVTINLTSWHLINVLITFFWFLGIINAVNLIDNMDGLASGVVIIALITLAVIRVLGLNGFEAGDAILGAILILLYAVAGFWIFNRPPASIFMGDSGSLFLGYLLAGLTVAMTPGGVAQTSATIFALLLPVSVLAVPLFDTTLVSASRFWHGRPVSEGGRDHSSHRLVGLGFSETVAVYLLYGVAAVGGLIAIALHLWPVHAAVFALIFAVILIGIGVYLGKVRVYHEPSEGGRRRNWTPLVTNILYKRHAAEIVLDFFIIAVSYYLAYYLRFEGVLREASERYVESLPVVIASCLLGLYVSGIYRGIWHFISIPDIGRFFKGVIAGLAGSIFLTAVLYQFEGYSRAVFAIFGILLFLMLVGSRLSFRILDDIVSRRNVSGRTKNILIYGAGQAGKLLYEECGRNPAYRECRVVGFIDDDAEKQNRSISGIAIYGDPAMIGQPLGPADIHEVWISSSQIGMQKIETVRGRLCERCGHDIAVRRFAMRVEEIGSGA